MLEPVYGYAEFSTKTYDYTEDVQGNEASIVLLYQLGLTGIFSQTHYQNRISTIKMNNCNPGVFNVFQAKDPEADREKDSVVYKTGPTLT